MCPVDLFTHNIQYFFGGFTYWRSAVVVILTLGSKRASGGLWMLQWWRLTEVTLLKKKERYRSCLLRWMHLEMSQPAITQFAWLCSVQKFSICSVGSTWGFSWGVVRAQQIITSLGIFQIAGKQVHRVSCTLEGNFSIGEIKVVVVGRCHPYFRPPFMRVFFIYTPYRVIIHSGKDGTAAAISFIAMNASKECSVGRDLIRKVEQ